ncbi:hypothetical protein N665_0210s0046 [Sinapis alba]|nr:hypothetical protein N665_0210s0046 [Sinapis alba]
MASAATNNSSTSTSENRGSSAQSRRPSPWSQIVRGESVPTISATPSSSPQSKAPIDPVAAPSVPLAGDERSEESGAQGNAGKKPVWKRPSSNDGGGASSEVGPVMGASSWPALSETTKAPSNKSSSDSLKSLGDVPSFSSVVPLSQGNANASVPARGRANPNSTPNHSRQRSFKRNGASGSAAANGTVSQPSAQGTPLVETPSHNPSPRGQNQKNGGFASSQTHGGSDNFSPRDSYRNQNGNHHHHHQSHGGRPRNQEHGNQNWGFHRSFNGRDGNAHSQRGAPAFVRHQPPPMQSIPPQFMAAQPIQTFGSPVVPFPPELASPYYPRMPFVGPLSPGPVFYQVQDPPLNIKLQNQIHYYFSEENLIRDTYLRGHMDDHGFVPLHVIAGFKKVAELTDSIQQIVEALQGSPFVEVQGERIRKRYNWQHWLLPEEASHQSVDAVASGVRNLSIGQSLADPIGGSSSQLQPVGAENKAAADGQQQFSVVGQVNNLNDSDGANR